MTENWLVIIIIMGIFLLLDAVILGATYFLKRFSRRGFKRREKLARMVRESLVTEKLEGIESLGEEEYLDYFSEWFRVEQSVEIPESIRVLLDELSLEWGLLARLEVLLKSRSFRKRALGVDLFLSYGEKTESQLLYDTLQKEPTMLLRLKMVQRLCETESPQAVDYICDSMQGMGENYKTRILRILRDHSNLLIGWADHNRNREDSDGRRILIQAARSRLRDWYLPFLLELVEKGDGIVKKEARELVTEVYGDRELLSRFIANGPEGSRSLAVYHLFRQDLPDPAEAAELLNEYELHPSAVGGMKEKLRENPSLISELFLRYQKETAEGARRVYAEVLASRIQYFILRLNSKDKKEIVHLLEDLIELGLSSPLINFMNVNRNMSLEKELLQILAPHVREGNPFLRQCQLFLKASLQEELNLPPLPEVHGKPKIQLTRKDRMAMFFLILFVVSLPIGIFFASQGSLLPFMTGEEIFVAFLLNYHHIFAYYTLAINFFYLFLMLQSWHVINQQEVEWATADQKFLNSPGLMPSVSILAPAYNEETTIVQNVYSLLSLNYPNLQVIVINDGSKDRTIGRLVEQFNLKLVDYPLSDGIKTSPVLGLYKNDRIPNLLVIDKVNGGKADALNVGINAAGGEYICSIDADSLLEPEALSKLMFRILNSGTKTVAIGGNIIPVNGCRTKNGSIREIHLPDNRYARYQTIEYLRSFITGRLGWTRVNGLMIISGAFGAFSRKDVLDIGGYMTGTGSMSRDTVGEDMELVVRLIRHLNEKGKKFRIDYSHNANCWTEVPEKLGDLLKQRDRWHRGLIEILLYHKKMLFNRKYGSPGLLAFPYLFIFELLGPFWEFFGYCVLIFSLLFGLMSGQIFLFMFSIVVLFGILISGTSLFLAEKNILYFQGREFAQSMATVIEENFGYRQFMSLHRVYAFVAYLFRNKGWQKLNRKGFAPHEEKTGAASEG
ncbi:MAG: glycosyltransferase [Spirochaetales bacterium]|nr:glycosyltransferase [Spirochaetales bacterium]